MDCPQGGKCNYPTVCEGVFVCRRTRAEQAEYKAKLKAVEAPLERGYYWVRFKGYEPITLMEWNGENYWYSMGVSATTQMHEIEVMSPKLPAFQVQEG